MEPFDENRHLVLVQDLFGPVRLELVLDRRLAEAYMYRGVLHTAMGNTRDAQKDLQRLTRLNADLAKELQWVIDNGKEKEPAQFFGVAKALSARN